MLAGKFRYPQEPDKAEMATVVIPASASCWLSSRSITALT